MEGMYLDTDENLMKNINPSTAVVY